MFTTPAIAALRTRFPAAHLTYIVEPAAAPIVTGNPHLNDIIVAPRARGVGGLVHDVALGRRLRAQRYDLAIDFHGGPRAALLTWLSGAPIRIGYEIAGRAWMYTHRVARPRALRPRHSVENQWDLLAPLDIAPPDRAQYPMAMPLDSEIAVRVTDRLSRAGVSERLDEPDIAQDVEGPVHGPQTHARQMPADALEDRLSREMCAVFERSQDGGSLLREPILALEKTGIDTV